VLQPNGSAYSEGEVAILSEAIGILRVTLAAPTYASQKTFGLSGWGKWTSAEFAAYTAGILAGDGYLTHVVSAGDWPDGVHTWILVGLSVGERTAWVPVEASPEMGTKQTVLGRLPEDVGPDGVLWFPSAYVQFTDVAPTRENRPPIAKITTQKTDVSTTDYTTLTATGSYDPDGTIILYVWDFGDGEPPEAVGSKYAKHRFAENGTYLVTLTVVDQQGGTGTATIEIKAAHGCGCG